MGNSNSGRTRIRPYLGMLLRLGVADVADLRDGNWRPLRWSNGSNIGVHGTNFGIELRFSYDGYPIRQRVDIERLACNFGGTRPMLRCPPCGRRRRYLYLSGGYFVCRTCARAPYWTQTASPDARMVYGIRRLQQRLAPDEDVDDYVIDWVPRRPSGMRRATYRRLVDRINRLIDKRDEYLEPRLLWALEGLMTPEELAALLTDPPT